MIWEKLIKSNLGAIRSEALDKIIAAVNEDATIDDIKVILSMRGLL